MSEGFVMSAHMAEVFFWYVRRYKVPCEEKPRLAVIRRLVAKKKATYLPHPEEFLKGKKALVIRRKPDDTRN